MDKTEYKIRAEEIKSLMKAQRFADAVKIADTIDWKRVKSVGMLCTISDLYKMNRRLEESRDILLLAYDRSPTRREIVYSLCELAIAMGEFVQAVEYYKEFVRLAPRNTARYILQYKLYEAQEVSLEERIAVLEEYKKHDYNEKWAYALAYLYHRVGLTTECVEECDELFLYMREGRYVMKALELKSLHEPLSPDQRAAYLKYKAETGGTISAPKMSEPMAGRDVKEGSKTPTKEIPQIPENFEAGDLAAQPTGELPNIKESNVVPDDPTQIIGMTDEQAAEPDYADQNQEQYLQNQTKSIYDQDTRIWPTEATNAANEDPVAYEVPTINVSDYNTVDLQKEIAQNLKEVLINNPDAALFADARGPQVIREDDEQEESTGEMFDTTENMDVPEAPAMSEVFYEDKAEEKVPEQPDSSIYYEETKRIPSAEINNYEKSQEVGPKQSQEKVSLAEELKDKEIAANLAATAQNEYALFKDAVFTDEPLQDEIPGAVIRPNVRYKINHHFDKMLSQEYDGQISMAIDEEKQVEKQITGQISLNDYLSDWENYKKDQQQKQLQNVKNIVASETGELFKSFDSNLVNPMFKEERDSGTIKEVLIPGQTEAIMQETASLQNQMSGSTDASTDYVPEYQEEIQEENPSEAQPIIEAQQPAEEIQSQPVNLIQEQGQPEIQMEIPAAQSSEEYVQEELPLSNEGITQEVSEDLREIRPVEDLQNTQSMVQLSGEELQFAQPVVEEEPEEHFDESQIADEYPDDEDLEAEERRAEEISSAGDRNVIRELSYSEEEDTEAADIDLGETTEIEADALESELNALKEEMPKPQEHVERRTVTKAPKKETPLTEKEEKDMETRVRVMTPEEKELFGPYIHHKKSRKQIIDAIDNLSMAAYTDNAIVTGEEGAGTVNLAKGLIKAIQATDSNFSGKVAMISAITLNKRTVSTIFDKIANGALIIRRAADLKEDTVATLLKQLQIENKGYIIIIEDTKDDIDRLLDKYPALGKCFNVRVDIEALDDDALVAYAKQYALEKEYVIDNLGILALHQKISERQTLDHEVTVSEVKEMVDDAIYYAEKKSVGHVVDVLLRKRFDEDDMIILREKDFLH